MKKLLTILCLLFIVNTHAQETICLVESCDEHFDYAMWLDDVLQNLQTQAGNNASKAKHYTATGSFTENGNGTAILSLNAINLFDANVKFAVTVNFSGKANNLSWQTDGCDYTATTTGWYGYSSFSGTLTGSGSLAGGKLSLTQKMGLPLQVGKGASLRTNTGKSASTWFMLSVVTQPTSLGSNQKYKLFPGNGDFNFCTNGSTKLSLTVSKFEANQTKEGVLIVWGLPTFEREKVQGYDLERSLDAKNWISLVSIPMDQTKGFYNYLDHPPLTTMVYYRLFMREHGWIRKPELISVPLKLTGMQIAPNPVVQGQKIKIFSSSITEEKVTLFSLDARQKAEILLSSGENNYVFRSPGVYLMRLQNGETKKIIVQ